MLNLETPIRPDAVSQSVLPFFIFRPLNSLTRHITACGIDVQRLLYYYIILLNAIWCFLFFYVGIRLYTKKIICNIYIFIGFLSFRTAVRRRLVISG